MKTRRAREADAMIMTALAVVLMSACSSNGSDSSPSAPGTGVETSAEPREDSPAGPASGAGSGDTPATLGEAGFTPSDVTAPPPALVARLSLDTDFYTSHLDALGIPIISSDSVSPYALAEARWVVERMLVEREDIATTIGGSSVRVAIMAVDEFTTDVPEHADLEPAGWWDRRARGLGATDARPAQSVGEENLLSLAGDPYADESIMVHEFAHVVHEQGMNTLDPGFDERLRGIFDQAVDERLWEGTYAAVNRNEYFAEGVQSWFDTNRENDTEHGPVNTRDELASHDPRLAALLTEVFGDNAWRYRRPGERETGLAHLEGFDRTSAPVFEWPADIVDIDISRPPPPEGVPLTNLVDEDWSAVRSPGGEAAPAVLTIVNRRSTDVRSRWVDFDGNRVPYETIVPDSSFRQGTFAGHLWEITDEGDVVIGRFRAPAGDAVVVLDD